MYDMSRHITPGEWQIETNPFGGTRRFRMLGNIKEYEPTVRIDGIDVPQSELEEFHQRRREAEERQRAAATASVMDRPKGICPFKMAKNELNVACERECAFFGGTSCVLAVTVTQPFRDTQGKPCPVVGKCRADCTLYANGCKLIELVKGL